jgi:hypothetical protein
MPLTRAATISERITLPVLATLRIELISEHDNLDIMSRMRTWIASESSDNIDMDLIL